MADRKLHEPFTLPVFGKLQQEINDMCINIKIHHVIDFKDETEEEKQKTEHLKNTHPKPRWEEIPELLHKIYNHLEQYRENPIKYKRENLE